MSNLFSQVLNMSVTGSVVIVFVIAARYLLRRAPKIFSYTLWFVVLFRLLCPVSLPSPVSILELFSPEIMETTDQTSTVSYLPPQTVQTVDFIAVYPQNNTQLSVSDVPQTEVLKATPMHIAALVWLSGAAIMLLNSILQYLLLRWKLVGSIAYNDKIRITDHTDTAFVIGLLRPIIYLPTSLSLQERSYILAHEQHHIHRLDHVARLIAYLALCIHWFNPLVWVAFVLMGMDMEMSCDEAVIKKLGEDIRADYSASLLRLSYRKRILTGMPLAFGEGDTKSRILNMAKWKKPAKWVIGTCAVACICILAVCAFNPEKEKSIEEMTRRTVNEPVGTGIGDLFFTYPAGLTSELREVENWTREEEVRVLRGHPNRSQFDNHFMDHGIDFGGVVDFILPENREIRLEELTVPSEWLGLDYIAGSSAYPYAEMEYTLIKDGKDYIQMYLYSYSGRGYFLWFYTEQCDPAHKEAILNSVEVGNGGVRKTKLKQEEVVSLGLLNITIPKGYGYSRNETVRLEIAKPDGFRESITVGGVTARPNPNISIESSEDLRRWIEAAGIRLDVEGLSYAITDEPEYGDLALTLDDVSQGIPIIEEQHYFFIAGDIVYDVWFDEHQLDAKVQKQMLKSIWLKEPTTISGESTWTTSTGASPVQIGKLPEGYNYGFDQNRDVVFAWGNHPVGGVKLYPIPDGVYDPYDSHYFWLEEMGIPDFEDANLIYVGGMTSGDNGWVAEFASDVPSGTPATVHRRHTFKVVGDTLYDIWFDMLKISQDNVQNILSAVKLPQSVPEEATEKSAEDLAFEKCLAVMDAVADGSCQITSLQENTGTQNVSGYRRTFAYHQGDYLFTEQMVSGAEAGEGGSFQALLAVGDESFRNAGLPDKNGDIHWEKAEPVEPEVPWLGNRVWVKSFVAYIDTLVDEAGNTTYMWRYDKVYEDQEGFADYYFVNFHFDPHGRFSYVDIQVNLFQENAFTITEMILSMEADTVNAEIQKEYRLATA